MSTHDQVLMHRREWMSWGHVVAIESYPQNLVAWGEVMFALRQVELIHHEKGLALRQECT
jgi:hypothetical protein